MNKNKEKKQLLSNFLSLSGLQMFTYALPLITLPYLVQVLGVDKYGLVMFAQSLVIFFNILVDYGFNLSATRDISVNRDSKDIVTEVFSSVMTLKILILFIAFFIFIFIVGSVERFNEEKELYLLSYLTVVGQAIFPIWYFQGLERMKYITFVNILSRVAFTIAIFVFVNGESDYLLVPLFNGGGAILGGIYSLYLIKTSFKQSFKIQSFETLKMFFKDSTGFFLSRVSISIYTSSNIFVLGLFTNNIMVGYYSIAEKLYQALQSFYGPIVQALYPYIAKEKNITLFKRIFYSALLLNFFGVLILFLIGEAIFSILFHEKIALESFEVFNILLLANLVTVPSILLGYPFLAALGYAHHANRSVIIGSLAHSFSLFIFIYIDAVTIYNLAYAVVITEFIVFLYRIYWVRYKKLWCL